MKQKNSQPQTHARMCLVALGLFDQKEKIMTGELGLCGADKRTRMTPGEYGDCFPDSRASKAQCSHEKFIQLWATG